MSFHIEDGRKTTLTSGAICHRYRRLPTAHTEVVWNMGGVHVAKARGPCFPVEWHLMERGGTVFDDGVLEGARGESESEWAPSPVMWR